MAATLQPERPPPSTHELYFERWEDTVDEIFADVFRPRPRLNVSQWSEQRRVLSRETSAEPGPWRNDRTPYLVEIMDALCDPDVTEMVIMKSARVGYTEGVIGNGIGYFIDQEPCPILVLQPAEDDAEDWSKKQLAPMLRDCEVLARKFPDAGTRNPNNTILDKIYEGGSITIRGAHSPRGLRRITARVVFFDEVSAFLLSAGSEGDPVKLGEARANTFSNRKVVKGSTPTVEGLCRISKDFARSDQRYWFVPCPHCGHEQRLQWGGPDTPYGIKWDREAHCSRCETQIEGDVEECPECQCREFNVEHNPDSAYYLCEACAVPIEEHLKDAMVQAGRWVRTRPTSSIPGWHISAPYSLISDKARWPNLVREWLDAQDDPVLLQVFVNTVLGEAWKGTRDDKFSADSLASRIEEWRDDDGNLVDVPDGVGVLTASVDVQDNRLELLVKGWGEREESWVIAHHRIWGDPMAQSPWARLEALRTKPYRHASGAELRIQCMIVDAGYATDAVYGYVRTRESQQVYAAVGRAGDRPPLSRASKANREGIKIWTLGIDALKDRIASRLRIRQPGPGYMHFGPSTDTGGDAEFYAQYLSERKVTRRVKGNRMVTEWIKTRARNEAFDLEVYAFGALQILGAGVREQLGAIARSISERGDRHREALGPTRGRRRMRSRGIQ